VERKQRQIQKLNEMALTMKYVKKTRDMELPSNRNLKNESQTSWVEHMAKDHKVAESIIKRNILTPQSDMMAMRQDWRRASAPHYKIDKRSVDGSASQGYKARVFKG